MQRLADSVAGRFCYTVMAAAAATFSFWALAGTVDTDAQTWVLRRVFPLPSYLGDVTCLTLERR